jgi:ribosomal protein S18 acetylase RimI-like enzyme
MHELFDEVEELHRIALPAIFKKPDEPRASAYLDEYIASPGKIALVADEGTLVGLVFAYVRESKPAPVVRPALLAEIDTLVVRQASRRRGIGRALVQGAVAWAREQSVDRIELGVFQFNEPARAFWQSVGFEILSLRMVLSPTSNRS